MIAEVPPRRDFAIRSDFRNVTEVPLLLRCCCVMLPTP